MISEEISNAEDAFNAAYEPGSEFQGIMVFRLRDYSRKRLPQLLILPADYKERRECITDVDEFREFLRGLDKEALRALSQDIVSQYFPLFEENTEARAILREVFLNRLTKKGSIKALAKIPDMSRNPLREV